MRCALAVALLFAIPAQAQQLPCGDYQEVLNGLSQNYGESVVAQGFDDRGVLVQVFAAETGTYTLVVIRPSDKVACVISAGNGWEAVAPKAPGQGS